MPRQGRVLLANTPHHVVQRGHNRQTVFGQAQDFHYYLNTLDAFKRKLNVKVYAFCLMTNHVHLIVEPPDDVTKLSALMKRLAGRQTRYVNRIMGRSGTLWGGRYKSSPIQTANYFLSCCRYVELNPIRAGMVSRPEDYQWSSFRERIACCSNRLHDQHPCFAALGSDKLEQITNYRRFMREIVRDDEISFIRQTLQRGQLTGDNKFVQEVEALIGRPIPYRGPGRQAK